MRPALQDISLLPHPFPAVRTAFLGVLLAALASACTGVRTLADPTVVVETTGGIELGVTTDYGVVFLGRTAQAGRVHVTAWFGDGPQTEASVIEPVGAGVFTAETEIRLPSVPMNFRELTPGRKVLVVGRRGDETWSREVKVRGDSRVEGILLPSLREIERDPSQIGAGVLVLVDDDENQKELVGLVSGSLTLEDGTGSERYTTVVGIGDLWRLIAHRRDVDRIRRPVSREDVE
jgi:hypothetical protein